MFGVAVLSRLDTLLSNPPVTPQAFCADKTRACCHAPRRKATVNAGDTQESSDRKSVV